MREHPVERHRPRDLSPLEVGFTKRKAVPWLNPGLLAGTAIRVVLAYLLGGYLDKRELQAALPAATHDHARDDELWLDYTADLGDGFDATYSIAYLLAQPTLSVGEGQLPRGRVLVLGGDQVYPTASAKEYEDRWKGPYRAALPQPSDESPTIYALPGNHDWYDGLTSFLRLFGQGDSVGGWRTAQTRSYFALQLPHRWWVLAIDTQLDSYIDEPQLSYFEQVAAELGPDDRVILCVPRPAWVMAEDHPAAYDSVDYFIRTILEPTGAKLPLILSGDYHHYARYVSSDDGPERQLVTCGGGGAYLVGTAHLPTEVDVPPPVATPRKASPRRRFRLAETYPSRAASRAIDWSVFARLPWKNAGFVALLGLMQTLLMLALLTLDGRWVNAATGFAVAFVFVGTLAFSTLLSGRAWRHWVAGTLHAVPHVALGVAGAAVWSVLPFVDAPAPWHVLLAFVLYLPVIGVLDTWVLAAYLLVARYARVNVSELYAGLGIDDHRAFLRLHLDAEGALTIYPIAVDRVARQWRANPDADDEAPWIVPTTTIDAHLIEAPITLR